MSIINVTYNCLDIFHLKIWDNFKKESSLKATSYSSDTILRCSHLCISFLFNCLVCLMYSFHLTLRLCWHHYLYLEYSGVLFGVLVWCSCISLGSLSWNVLMFPWISEGKFARYNTMIQKMCYFRAGGISLHLLLRFKVCFHKSSIILMVLL